MMMIMMKFADGGCVDGATSAAATAKLQLKRRGIW